MNPSQDLCNRADQTTRKLYGLTPEQIERFDNWTPACI